MNVQEFTITIPDDVAEKAALRTHTPGVKCSNRGGIQSYFYKDNLDWMSSIVEQVKELFPDYTIYDGWFNNSGPGSYNCWHRHIKDQFSAVVYIQVPENSGDIEFKEGREILKIQPTIGKVVGFPSDMMHRVLENKSNDLRISAAFNLIRL